MNRNERIDIVISSYELYCRWVDQSWNQYQMQWPNGHLLLKFSMFLFQTKASKDGRSPSIWDAFCALPGKIQNGDTGLGTSSWWEGTWWELLTDSVRHILDNSVRCMCWFIWFWLIILSSNFWQGQRLGYLCVFTMYLYDSHVSNCDTSRPILSGLPGNNACEHYYSPLVAKDFWQHDSVTYHSVTEDLQKMWSWWRTGHHQQPVFLKGICQWDMLRYFSRTSPLRSIY